MIFGRVPAGLLGAASPIKNLQKTLVSIGMPVQPTGVLDQATVDAVNGVFDGLDIVPSKLRTGRLTKHDVAAQIGVVTKYVKLAAGGAMNVNAEHY